MTSLPLGGLRSGAYSSLSIPGLPLSNAKGPSLMGLE